MFVCWEVGWFCCWEFRDVWVWGVGFDDIRCVCWVVVVVYVF